jgi:hypothetical protein
MRCCIFCIDLSPLHWINRVVARMRGTGRKSGEVKEVARKTHTPTKPAQNISGLFFSVVSVQNISPGRANAKDRARIADCNE